MKSILVLVISFFLCSTAFAGNATGRVSSIHVADNSVVVLFSLSSEIEGSPRCNENRRFSIGINKPGGMAAYTALLEAKRQGYEVTVEGTNTCVNEWKTEDIKNILLH